VHVNNSKPSHGLFVCEFQTWFSFARLNLTDLIWQISNLNTKGQLSSVRTTKLTSEKKSLLLACTDIPPLFPELDMELRGLQDSDEHAHKTSPSAHNLYDPSCCNGWEGGQFCATTVAYVPEYVSAGRRT